MKIVGVLRKGVVLEVDKIPGGVGPKGIIWGASSSGSPGVFYLTGLLGELLPK